MSDPTPQETASYQRGFHDGNAAAHGEIARLNAEVEQLRDALRTKVSELAEQDRTIERLQAALRKYGGHIPTRSPVSGNPAECPKMGSLSYHDECWCGWDDVIATIGTSDQ